MTATLPQSRNGPESDRNSAPPQDEEYFKPPVFIRIPPIHRAKDTFDELPDEILDPSIGAIRSPEREP